MFHALKVTGETYPNRRAIRALGGVWQSEESAYMAPLEKADQLRAIAGLIVSEVTLDADPFRPLSPDELRKYRQAKIERRRERLLDRAERAERRASEAWNKVSPSERDFLRLMEPVKKGHHSQRRHEKLIERNNRAFEESGRESSYAADLRSKAEWLGNARVKGDAAREHEAARLHALSWLGLGDHVSHVVYGRGVVVDIGKKTALVRRLDASTFRVCVTSLSLVEKGQGVAPPKAPPAFKAGDQVLWYRHGIANAAMTKATRCTIKRRTPRGYSVEYTLPSFKAGEVYTYTDTASERDLVRVPSEEVAPCN